jgi:hypothetical protein
MFARLLTQQSLFFHQPTYFETAHGNAFIAKHLNKCSSARGLTTFIEQTLHSGAQNTPLSTNQALALSSFVITTDTNT